MVDTGTDGLESYVDVVGRVIQQESWIKTENQQRGRRLGFQSRKPNNQHKTGGSGGKPQTGSKRKNEPGNQSQLEQFGGSKQARWNLSNGHFAISVKDGIWVILMIHQDSIIVEELAI